jgi:Arc/MetJ family transcription regulator
VIFRAIGDGRPYPDHGRVRTRDWTEVPPRVVRLAELTTTKRNLQLDSLLADDSTFHGDLFCHVVAWRGELYLEDGVHRALRAALNGRDAIHARVLELPG